MILDCRTSDLKNPSHAMSHSGRELRSTNPNRIPIFISSSDEEVHIDKDVDEKHELHKSLN